MRNAVSRGGVWGSEEKAWACKFILMRIGVLVREHRTKMDFLRKQAEGRIHAGRLKKGLGNLSTNRTS